MSILMEKLKYLFRKRKFRYIKNSPDYNHLKDRNLFKALYNEVGTVHANKSIRWREEWMGHFKPKPGSTILELGAHNGPNLLYYGKKGHTITGVEISDTLIETFNKHLNKESEELRKRVKMIQSWIEEFEADEKYDYVLCTEILEHVVDPMKILEVARKSLKEEGLVYIAGPTTHWGNNTHVRGVPEKDLKKWLTKSGLKEKSMFVENNRTFCYAGRVK